jgi:redox-sensing transcriptional repressor
MITVKSNPRLRHPPEISILRLSVYLRFLEDYCREHGPRSTIRSEALASALDLKPHQIRKDFSYFGTFGNRGVGYRAQELRDTISTILGLHRRWNLGLCGMGNLGAALLAYRGFHRMNMRMVAIFDTDPRKIGRSFEGVKVHSPDKLKAVAGKVHIDIGIIAVPSAHAQEMADKLVAAGIRAILNFAPVKLTFPAGISGVKVRNVDLSTELVTLTHFLSK